MASSHFMQTAQTIACAVLSGSLMAMSFPPVEWHALAWIAFVPWFLRIPRLSPRETWVMGAILGVVFYRIALSWMFGISAPLAMILIVIYAIIMGLSFRVAKLLSLTLGSSALWYALPFCFLGQEILRSEGLSQLRLSYAALGYSQAPNNWMAQAASLGGVYLLSFFVLIVNSALAFFLQHRSYRSFLPLFATVVAILSCGFVSQSSSQPANAHIRVACIQSECPNDREYIDLVRQALGTADRPRILVLPEHTIEGDADRPHPFVDQLARIAREFKAYIVVGAHVRAPNDLQCDYDNVALLIGPNGEIIGHQAKSVPVPFFHDGNPARSQRTFPTDVGELGLCVCFDTDFSDITRRLVDLGAELLLVPVMNPESWPIQQRIQQAAMAQIRSIELRRYSVRAASSGISQIVEPTGRVQCSRNLVEGPGILPGYVSLTNKRTFFVAGGHYFAQIVGWAFLLAVILLTLRRKTNATTSPSINSSHFTTNTG